MKTEFYQKPNYEFGTVAYIAVTHIMCPSCKHDICFQVEQDSPFFKQDREMIQYLQKEIDALRRQLIVYDLALRTNRLVP